RLRLVLGAIVLGMVAGASPAQAQSAAQTVTLGPSGLPLPRFVSLKSSRVNSRIGPGLNYSVGWMYTRAGLPMEIVQEYDTWRKVRDADGSEGWINQSLLSGKRTAIVAPWQRDKSRTIRRLVEHDRGVPVVGDVALAVTGTLGACDGRWWQLSLAHHTCRLEQTLLWGAYPVQ